MWIIEVNEICNTMKLPEDNIGENLGEFRLLNDFSDTIPKA